MLFFFFFFGRSGVAAGKHAMAYVIVGTNDYSPLRNGYDTTAAAPSGCPLQWPAGIGLSACWFPLFKEARGISNPTNCRPFPLPSLTRARPKTIDNPRYLSRWIIIRQPFARRPNGLTRVRNNQP